MKEWMARRYNSKLLYIVKVKITKIVVTEIYETIKIILDNSGFKLKIGDEGQVSQKLLFDERKLIEFIFSRQNSKDR